MIRLDNISKTFRDGDTQVQALKNISFEVNKGEILHYKAYMTVSELCFFTLRYGRNFFAVNIIIAVRLLVEKSENIKKR